jgi:small subunit ribosomal protein S16
MAVTIRLSRQGAKKHPYYRVMVADQRRWRDGSFLEQVGTYNPGKDPVVLALDLVAVDSWIKKGAQPSQTVRELIKLARKNAAAAPAAAVADAPKGDAKATKKA